MLTKLSLLIVPAALASVAAIAFAAPKSVPPQKPQVVPFVPPLQLHPVKPGAKQPPMPNMTQMPNSHIIAAFAVTASGRGLLLDTSGKVIGQSDLAKPSKIVWLDSRPVSAAPKTLVPKPKH